MAYGYRVPNFTENGDPLADDDRLLAGPRIADNTEGEGEHILHKSRSDQRLAHRWGTTRQSTGKSKTGLVITVPPRGITAAPTSGVVSGSIVTENGITYQYTSSSSGGFRTTSSFGAIGERLTSRQNATGSHQDGGENINQEERKVEPPANLQELVRQSEAFQTVYLPLYKHGETGPQAGAVDQGILTITEQGRLRPKRRRSLSDIVRKRLKSSEADGGTELQGPMEVSSALKMISPSVEGAAELMDPGDETFVRRGPSFFQVKNMQVPAATDQEYDPLTLHWPEGSCLFMMKGRDIGYLRYAAKNGVCSIKPGANKVLEQCWAGLSPGARLFMIWSLATPPNPPHLRDIFFGVSEMAGPVDHYSHSPFPVRELSGKIPIKWIVFKDVSFSFFDDLAHNDVRVTQSRHANTIPKSAGRETLRRYFESPHTDQASIHPEFATSVENLGSITRVLDYDVRAGRYLFPSDRKWLPSPGLNPGISWHSPSSSRWPPYGPQSPGYIQRGSPRSPGNPSRWQSGPIGHQESVYPLLLQHQADLSSLNSEPHTTAAAGFIYPAGEGMEVVPREDVEAKSGPSDLEASSPGFGLVHNHQSSPTKNGNQSLYHGQWRTGPHWNG